MSELQGFTIWFTGLSGAGKSTIADLVIPELERLDALGALARAGDERPAVRGDQPGGHAATAVLTRPRCSR